MDYYWGCVLTSVIPPFVLALVKAECDCGRFWVFIIFFNALIIWGKLSFLSFGQGIDCISLPGPPHQCSELWVRDSGFF